MNKVAANNTYIQMFGEFVIRNENYKFPQETKKSQQVILLISYLIVNRNKLTSKAKLIGILWHERAIENPEGALRNLIYRARYQMKRFFPDEECILTRNNSYIWNNQIACELDIQIFETTLEAIYKENDLQQQLTLCKQMLETFQEDFMFEFPYGEWIEIMRKRYIEMKVDCTVIVCRKLSEQRCYQQVIELCNMIDYKDIANYKIHEQKLYAYYKIGRSADAHEYYQKIIDMYYQKRGVQVSQRLAQIHQLILEASNKNPVHLEELEREMMEEESQQGTFYCNFDVFKIIYRIHSRIVNRYAIADYLVALSLKYNKSTISDHMIINEAAILHNVIFQELRKNDVFSKCNSNQFILIISTQSEEGCQAAIKRIVKKYAIKQKEKSFYLLCEMKRIGD